MPDLTLLQTKPSKSNGGPRPATAVDLVVDSHGDDLVMFLTMSGVAAHWALNGGLSSGLKWLGAYWLTPADAEKAVSAALKRGYRIRLDGQVVSHV